jgi:broad specificity phosphatase PhoE
MSRPVLYYIRHGETDWNAAGRLQGTRDTVLNALGRKQAAACADILRELLACDKRAPADYVASPLKRARETMEIMRAALDLPREGYRIDARLREIGFGAWEGLTMRDLRVRAPQALAARERDKWDFVPPDGESYAAVAERVRAWHAELGGDAVVVAHGGTARALIAILGIASPAKAPLIDIDQGVVYRFADGSMSKYA